MAIEPGDWASTTHGRPRVAPVLHCLRAFRQIAGSAGSQESKMKSKKSKTVTDAWETAALEEPGFESHHLRQKAN